jgi:hypothetical protein
MTDGEKVKIVLLGELGAGKTALFLRFAVFVIACRSTVSLKVDTFLQEDTFFSTVPPIEDPVKARQLPIDDARVKIEVGDTAGIECPLSN